MGVGQAPAEFGEITAAVAVGDDANWLLLLQLGLGVVLGLDAESVASFSLICVESVARMSVSGDRGRPGSWAQLSGRARGRLRERPRVGRPAGLLTGPAIIDGLRRCDVPEVNAEFPEKVAVRRRAACNSPVFLMQTFFGARAV